MEMRFPEGMNWNAVDSLRGKMKIRLLVINDVEAVGCIAECQSMFQLQPYRAQGNREALARLASGPQQVCLTSSLTRGG